jgi:hypothetical protein
VLVALIWLGADWADRAAHAVRLVQTTRQGKTWAYITNELEAQRVSLADISQLYAGRCDIEPLRVFNLVKTHLPLHWLWSSQVTVVILQVYAVFTVAQIILGWRAEIAARVQTDVDEVSLVFQHCSNQSGHGLSATSRYAPYFCAVTVPVPATYNLY